MYNLKLIKLRDLEEYKIYCVSSMMFSGFQSIFLHYIKIGCECADVEVETTTYHDLDTYKHDRNILEEILEKQEKEK